MIKQLRRDQSGAALVLFALAVPVLLGGMALSLDLGRYHNMDTELQSLADAAALAAVKDLDGRSDAMERANAAVAAVVNDAKLADQWPSTGSRILDAVYASAWADLADPTKHLTETSGHADNAKAAFVQVITKSATTKGLVLPIIAGTTNMVAKVRATAGSTTVACAVQPMFMCMPGSTSGITLTPGMMIRVKEQPGNSWGPGNFGLLDPPNAEPNQKNDLLKQGLAQSSPNVCYVNSLTPAQGSKSGPVKEAINARFDIWDNNPDVNVRIAPGPNNLKGMSPTPAGGSCVKSNPIDFTTPNGKMPQDPCFSAAGGCRGSNSPYGTGGWSGTAYWETHHGVGTYPVGGFSTRFAMYMAQLGLNANGTSAGTAPSVTGTEQMGPTCSISKGYGGPGSWERRVIYAAMIDCTANASWLIGNSTSSPVREADIGQFFLTEPTTQGQEVYLEFVKIIKKDDVSGKLRSVIQLYPNPQDGGG